jgi:DNA polymerase III subunit epsilon
MEKRSIKKMFYDVETTGVDERQNGIHQIAGCIEIDGEVVQSFNFKVAPNPKAKIVQEALAVGGVTEEQIKAYAPMGVVFKQFNEMLSKYVERYDKSDKMYLVGYNNAHFDDDFLRAWFVQNGDSYFGSWFYAGALDVMVLASQYLIDRRYRMKDFKLMTVAQEVGLVVDESRLYDANYDIELTRGVYRIVTGIDYEL